MEPISERPKKKSIGRRKIPIQKIQDNSKRHVAFSKRRMGLFKKAGELCALCNSEIAVIAFSEAGSIFTFGHPNADSVIQRYLHGSSSFSSSSPICNQHNNSVAQTICNAGSKTDEKGGAFWWESPVDSLGLEELRVYAKTLEVLMSNVAAKATSLASSSSDVAVGTAMVYPSTVNVSQQGIEIVTDLE